MRRFSDLLSDCEYLSETTNGRYCLYDEAMEEIERLRAENAKLKGEVEAWTRAEPLADIVLDGLSHIEAASAAKEE